MQHPIENEILTQLLELMEKSGFQSLVPLYPTDSLEDENTLDTLLITVKSINARYDRSEALAQIHWLLNKYNIQVDQLVDKQGIG
jgi:hypothetical protein